jgi:hypothetical protein
VLGDTRYEVFLKAGADSGDSTAWLVGGRYGRYRFGRTTIMWRHGTTVEELRNAGDRSLSSQFADYVEKNFHHSMDDIKTGNQQFYIAAKLMRKIEGEIRRCKAESLSTLRESVTSRE